MATMRPARPRHRRYWRAALMVLLPVAMYAVLAERSTWRPRVLYTGVIVRGLCFTPDGKTLMVGGLNTSNEYELQYWDVRRHEKTRVFNLTKMSGGNGNGTTAFNDDGSLIAVGLGLPECDSHLHILRTATGKLIRKTDEIAGQGVQSLAFSPDSRYLALGSGRYGAFDVWEVKPWRRVQHYRDGPDESFYAAAFSADGGTVAAAGLGFTCFRWDMRSGRELKGLRANPQRVGACLAFSPTAPLLALGHQDGDGDIAIWDNKQSRLARTLRGHTDEVHALTFSRDGKILVSGSYDKTVRLWDVATGLLLQTLTGYDMPLDTLALSPDGSLLAAGDRDIVLRRLK